jgi:hypothetical protein
VDLTQLSANVNPSTQRTAACLSHRCLVMVQQRTSSRSQLTWQSTSFFLLQSLLLISVLLGQNYYRDVFSYFATGCHSDALGTLGSAGNAVGAHILRRDKDAPTRRRSQNAASPSWSIRVCDAAWVAPEAYHVQQRHAAHTAFWWSRKESLRQLVAAPCSLAARLPHCHLDVSCPPRADLSHDPPEATILDHWIIARLV